MGRVRSLEAHGRPKARASQRRRSPALTPRVRGPASVAAGNRLTDTQPGHTKGTCSAETSSAEVGRRAHLLRSGKHAGIFPVLTAAQSSRAPARHAIAETLYEQFRAVERPDRRLKTPPSVARVPREGMDASKLGGGAQWYLFRTPFRFCKAFGRFGSSDHGVNTVWTTSLHGRGLPCFWTPDSRHKEVSESTQCDYLEPNRRHQRQSVHAAGAHRSSGFQRRASSNPAAALPSVHHADSGLNPGSESFQRWASSPHEARRCHSLHNTARCSSDSATRMRLSCSRSVSRCC